jgi:hypothetical protein
VLSALDEFQVTQSIITVMLQTPPEKMYIFTADEVNTLGIDRGDDIEVALADVPKEQPSQGNNSPGTLQPNGSTPGWGQTGGWGAPSGGSGSGDTAAPASQAFVILAWRESEDEANRSVQYAKDMYAGAMGSALPEIATGEGTAGTIYGVRVPAASVENANAICGAIKSAGGGCYVASGG